MSFQILIFIIWFQVLSWAPHSFKLTFLTGFYRFSKGKCKIFETEKQKTKKEQNVRQQYINIL